MGKPHKDDVPASSGGMTPGRSVGRKRELGWQVVYIVTVMGFIGMLQLVVVEKTWWSSRYKQTPHASVDFGKTDTTTATMFQRSSPTSSQHAEPLPNSSRAPSCGITCASSDNKHTVQHQAQRDDHIESKPKNEKLLEFSPSNSFLPMKDETQQGIPDADADTNWFMSRLRGRMTGSGETFDLPGDDPDGRILCVRGADQDDCTKNSYGLFRTLPADAVLLPDTTFIADNYWDYHNPWHAMSALANFATWRIENQCAVPERLILYHMGELVISMGEWIAHVLKATFMKPIRLEDLTLIQSSAVCFERAVVQRRGLGGVDDAHMHGVFDMLRCKARRYCNVSQRRNPERAIAVLLLTRSGPRAFANESGVAAVVRSECEKVPGCSLRVLNAGNLTFCQQVEVMSSTDVMISVHGAQFTNMMFMDPGSQVMELFPKGWLEFAGLGQHVYQWHASWTRVVHSGQWHDHKGPNCPFPTSETLKCLFFFKDRKVGLNATHLALWTHYVLAQHNKVLPSIEQTSMQCTCDENDYSGLFGVNLAKTSKL